MQSLVELARQIRFDGEDLEVWDLFFRRAQTKKACQVFLEWLKANGQGATRRQVSQFGRDLQHGRIELGFTYNRARALRMGTFSVCFISGAKPKVCF